MDLEELEQIILIMKRHKVRKIVIGGGEIVLSNAALYAPENSNLDVKPDNQTNIDASIEIPEEDFEDEILFHSAT